MKEESDARGQQQHQDHTPETALVQPAEQFEAAHVPNATAGSPIRNRLSVPGATVPVPPRNSAVSRNTNTPTGWNTARCSGGGHPRNVHQMVRTIPAKPVAPPSIPFSVPTMPSVKCPA